VRGRSGWEDISVQGALRQDLRDAVVSAGLYDFTLGVVKQSEAAWNYECVSDPCASDADHAALLAVGEIRGTLRAPTQFNEVQRARPAAPGGERLVMIADSDYVDSMPAGHLLTWDPEARRARLLLALPNGYNRIAGATASAALAVQRPYGVPAPRGSWFVSLDSSAEPVFFPSIDARDVFRLLEPAYLYNTRDLRFYRLTAPLAPTTMPAPLADVPGNPLGDYHAIAAR
jgi:hypothetical protein